MTGLIRRMAARASLGAMAGLALVMGVCAAEPPQQSYASPDDAAAALAAASRSHDTAALRVILGPGSEALISSGDQLCGRGGTKSFRRKL